MIWETRNHPSHSVALTSWHRKHQKQVSRSDWSILKKHFGGIGLSMRGSTSHFLFSWNSLLLFLHLDVFLLSFLVPSAWSNVVLFCWWRGNKLLIKDVITHRIYFSSQKITKKRGRQTERQRETSRQRGRDRQTDRQRGRDRQTDRQTERPRERNIER